MEEWSTTEWSMADWVTCAIFVAVTAVGIFYWVRLFHSSAAKKEQFLIDHSVSARWGLIDVLAIAFLWLACQAFTLQLLAWWNGIQVGQTLTGDQAARFGVIIGIVQIVVVGFALVYLAKRYEHQESDFGMSQTQIRSGVIIGAIAFSMWIPVVWALQTVLVFFIEYSHPAFDRVSQSRNPRTLIDAWISAVVIAPIVEEILFRGVIQGWLQRFRQEARSDPNALILGGETASTRPDETEPKRPIHVVAILITSLLFGLAHFSQGPAPISLFVLSIGIGYVYQRTGSLVACIVMHMLLNAVTMFLFTIGLFTG